MATRAEVKRRKSAGSMTLFEEEPKRTTRKARRDQRSSAAQAAPVEEKARTSRKAMRDKQAEKRAAERAAEAKKPKVTGGRGRVAGKKGIGAKLPAKPKVQKKAPGADAAAELGAANIALNKKLEKAKPKRKSVVKRILLGKDEKFGGERGLIDFLPGKSRPKRKKKVAGSPASGANRRPKPAGKAMGGMMKSKMASKGGARGGKKMMPGGMKAGGLAMTTVNGRKVPAFAADGKGPNDLAKKQAGGMMKSKGMAKGGAMTKKGMAKGGAMKKKGYAKGGMAKKGYSKGGAVRRGKPRGVGVALRGYGKALKK
jgi:hypothetical protein